MNEIFLAGILIGSCSLLYSRGRDRKREMDAFAALDRLRAAGPLGMPAAYVIASVSGAVGVAAGLPALEPSARATGALAIVVAVWLSWLAQWISMRWLLDAATVFQDHVPLGSRPRQAYSPAPHSALSFRPMAAALWLLIALAGTGVGFGVLSWRFGWTRFMPLLAGGVWAVIGSVFAAYVRAGLYGERKARVVLTGPARASDAEVLDALRRNPRSARLLLEHARRLEAAGEPLQALLEYRAAELAGSFERQARAGASRTCGRLSARPGPIEGSIVREPGEAQPRMRVRPLRLGSDAVRVRVIDRAAFLSELLALTDEGLILGIDGQVDAAMAEDLRAYQHLAPLVEPERGRTGALMRAWCLEPRVRDVLRERTRDGVPNAWLHVHLYTLSRLLVDARWHFSDTRIAPDLAHREFIEWRRAAAVAPLAASGASAAEQPQSGRLGRRRSS